MARWLITGCSTGFGREIARAALEAGHSVVVTARRADAVQDLVDEFGDQRVAVALDVTDAAQIAAAVAAADEAFGGIDVLVNNAGHGYLSAVEEGEDAEVRKLFDVNYFGAVDMIKAVLPADARPRVRPHHQHLVDDRPGGQPAQRVLLVDQVRPRGGDRGAGHRGRAAGHQGDRHRAGRLPHRLGDAVDEGIRHPDRRLRPTSAPART